MKFPTLAACFVCIWFQTLLHADDYKKITEGREVVMAKIYPKSERFELSLPEIGVVMNPSYVKTWLFGGSGTYFFTENMGISLSGSVASNSDKGERDCIENFYADPTDEVSKVCGAADALNDADKNGDGFPKYRPAYVPIRELQQVVIANFVWAPVYGKLLILKSATSYFDLFVEAGAGYAMSKYYAKRDTLNNGNPRDGKYNDPEIDPNGAAEANSKIGASAAETESYGIRGRPAPKQQGNALLNLGLGQKFHFGKLFFVKVYIRNMTLLGTDNGFENLLSLNMATGIRF